MLNLKKIGTICINALKIIRIISNPYYISMFIVNKEKYSPQLLFGSKHKLRIESQCFHEYIEYIEREREMFIGWEVGYELNG